MWLRTVPAECSYLSATTAWSPLCQHFHAHCRAPAEFSLKFNTISLKRKKCCPCYSLTKAKEEQPHRAVLTIDIRTPGKVVPRAPAWEGGYSRGAPQVLNHGNACKGCWTGFSVAGVELNTFSSPFSNKNN